MTVQREGRSRRFAMLLALVVLAAGCGSVVQQTVRGSGQIETREVRLGDVTEVRVGSTLDAVIVPGPEPSVTIRADDNVLDRVEVNERIDRVEVRLERGIRLRDATVDITLTMPSVTEVRASGASGVELDEGLEADGLRLSASGSSDLWGTVQVDRLDVSASGSSDVVLDGRAEQLAVRASGSSDVDLGQLLVDGDADVEASGSSDVGLHVQGSLQVTASGSSTVRYSGDPAAVTSTVTGSSSVQERD